VGLFLLGMTVMTAGLKAVAGPALRTALSKAAATPLRGGFWETPGQFRAVMTSSTEAAANGLDTNAELCRDRAQASSASLVGSADGRTPRRMDCRSTDRLAALGAPGLGPRHAGHHALADDRALELGKDAEHLKHRLAGRRLGVEALLMQKQGNLGFAKVFEEADEVLEATTETRIMRCAPHETVLLVAFNPETG
jgi:hypothetical protein